MQNCPEGYRTFDKLVFFILSGDTYYMFSTIVQGKFLDIRIAFKVAILLKKTKQKQKQTKNKTTTKTKNKNKNKTKNKTKQSKTKQKQNRCTVGPIIILIIIITYSTNSIYPGCYIANYTTALMFIKHFSYVFYFVQC